MFHFIIFHFYIILEYIFMNITLIQYRHAINKWFYFFWKFHLLDNNIQIIAHLILYDTIYLIFIIILIISSQILLIIMNNICNYNIYWQKEWVIKNLFKLTHSYIYLIILFCDFYIQYSKLYLLNNLYFYLYKIHLILYNLNFRIRSISYSN